jgi:RND superfamily putative drug exporter
VVRTVLVPALMHLFGAANWWLPGWLDRRLPTLPIESEPAPAPAEHDAPAVQRR